MVINLEVWKLQSQNQRIHSHITLHLYPGGQLILSQVAPKQPGMMFGDSLRNGLFSQHRDT